MADSLDQQLRALVRDVPDFPKPGLLFRDLTPVMRDPQAWRQVMEGMQASLSPLQPEVIVGICLLYTSPSPRDVLRSRMPSSA